LPFGLAEIDARLPAGGLALGALHEVAGGGNGAIDGAAAALFVAGIPARTRGKSCGVSTGPISSPPGRPEIGPVIYLKGGDEKTVLEALSHSPSIGQFWRISRRRRGLQVIDFP
jgi:protein ImuA